MQFLKKLHCFYSSFCQILLFLSCNWIFYLCTREIFGRNNETHCGGFGTLKNDLD
jgi:hypothetical protein